MKKLRRLMAFVLVGGLMASMTGCGLFDKTPSAEELLSKTYSEEECSYVDADVIMDIGAKIDVSELSDGEVDNMAFSLGADMNIKGDKECQKIAGDFEVNILGMNVSEELEAYSITVDDITTTYTYDADSDTWYFEEEESEKKGNLFEGFGVEYLDSYEMKEVAKEDTEYVINAVMSYDKLPSDQFDFSDLEDLGFDEDSFEDLKFDVVFTFDRETELIKSLEISADTDALKGDDVEFTELSISINVNEICNDKTVEVPEDIIEDAIPADEKPDTPDFSIDTTDMEEDYESDIDVEDFDRDYEEYWGSDDEVDEDARTETVVPEDDYLTEEPTGDIKPVGGWVDEEHRYDTFCQLSTGLNYVDEDEFISLLDEVYTNWDSVFDEEFKKDIHVTFTGGSYSSMKSTLTYMCNEYSESLTEYIILADLGFIDIDWLQEQAMLYDFEDMLSELAEDVVAARS